MKIKDLNQDSIRVGLRVKSVAGEKLGTVVRIERDRDNLAWILWDGEWQLRSAFHDNDCECELVTEENK